MIRLSVGRDVMQQCSATAALCVLAKADASRVFRRQAAVCRCSQPLSGFSARCLEDESMLQAISKANHNSRFVYVMDTRPKVASGNELLLPQVCSQFKNGVRIAVLSSCS